MNQQATQPNNNFEKDIQSSFHRLIKIYNFIKWPTNKSLQSARRPNLIASNERHLNDTTNNSVHSVAVMPQMLSPDNLYNTTNNSVHSVAVMPYKPSIWNN